MVQRNSLERQRRGNQRNESKPVYQKLITTPSTTQRTVPDVAADANPSSGVAVLDSSAGGIGSANPWFNGFVGGTSLAAPLWAGFIAMVNQGRSLLSTPLTSLNGVTQTLPRIYTLSSSDYHDITSGSAGSFCAAVGYDLITGRGSPKVNLLAPTWPVAQPSPAPSFRITTAMGFWTPASPFKAASRSMSI